MAIRLTANMIERLHGHLGANRTAEMLAHEVVELTQNDMVKVRVPGNVTATFKRPEDVGKTFKAIYGGFGAQQILDTQGARILAGEYAVRAKASDELKVSAAGQKNLGGLAFESLLLAAAESPDVTCNEWAEACLTATPSDAGEVEHVAKKPRTKKADVTVGELVGKV